jgi:hypothetical protein
VRGGDRDPHDGVVARNGGIDKACGHRAAIHHDAQPAMRQRLVMICDRFAIELCNAKRTRDLECVVTLRQLPQAAEQALRLAAREDDVAVVGKPQRGTRQDG